MNKILVTGGKGFIGRKLCSSLIADNDTVKVTTGGPDLNLPEVEGVEEHIVIEDMSSDKLNWEKAVHGVQTIVHLAARVHHMREKSSDPYLLYSKINTEATLKLANEAIKASVKRFVFVSTSKVHGEGAAYPYNEKSNINNPDPYAKSKAKAEEGLMELARRNPGFEVVIVRPAIIYGPYVRANMDKLFKWGIRGLPYPFGNSSHKTSVLFIENMIDALKVLIHHPKAANEAFLVGDRDIIASEDLYKQIAEESGRVPILLPLGNQRWISYLPVLGQYYQRLTKNFIVETGKIYTLLGWEPPYSLKDGIKETTQWYLKQS